eukprot:m.342173 g.342173  ORF g.342173 m.342173 type:complete len:573 (-) comp21069_c0_seq1:92-1810(-)
MSEVFLFALFTIFFFQCGADNNTAIISTKFGTFNCNKLPAATECLGIPFAEPPIGKLRWMPPILKEELESDEIDANEYGPSCPQVPGQLLHPKRISEDCLTLNIWVPHTPKTTLLPVMFWIYGGGYTQGGSELYNASVLAATQNVIVVTVNYRVGALGFASFEEQSSQKQTTGNFGLLDQQCALRWVNKNIGSFGGDASRITTFGQSAGADSVILHYFLKGSRPLFQRGISESGGLDSIVPLNFSLNVTNQFISRLKCDQPVGEKRMDCLRSKSVEEILKQQDGGTDDDNSNPMLECWAANGCRTFLATADDVVLTGTAPQLIDRLSEEDVTSTSLPYSFMAGGCTSDGSLFAVDYYSSLNRSFYTEQLLRMLEKEYIISGNTGTLPKDKLQQALQLYPPSNRSDDPAIELAENTQQLVMVFTDSSVICPQRKVLDAFEKANALSQNASSLSLYFYRFNHNSTWTDTCYNSWPAPYGNATHTAEISYVFGQPLYLFGPPDAGTYCEFSSKEVTLANQVGGMWASFTRTGQPTTTTMWNSYTTQGCNDFVIDVADEGNEQGWRQQYCDLWNQL